MAPDSRPSTVDGGVSDVSHDLANYSTVTTHQSLSQAVHARRAEYTRAHKIKVKIGSWNVAACRDVEKDIGEWFVDGRGIETRLSPLNLSDGLVEHRTEREPENATAQEQGRAKNTSTLPLGDGRIVVGGDRISLYVLGLQEVVELASAKEYIGRVYTDPGPLSKWKKTLSDAMPQGYELVSEQQMSGLILMIYAAPDIAPTISSVSSVSVGTGLLGYLGNKGAISTRILLGETTRIVFVNCHLASGTDQSHLERRCWDVNQVLTKTRFDPISWGGVLDDINEGIDDADFAFWFGDLNFRLDRLPGDDIRRLLMLHTRGEYDIESKTRQKMDNELSGTKEPVVIPHVESDDDSTAPSTPKCGSLAIKADDTSSFSLPEPDEFMQDPHSDPASLQATLDSLLPHDQLRHVQKARKAFHDGWREGAITFLPTYKYDVGSNFMFDSSEKQRAPSWCDRILFRTRRDKIEYDERIEEEELAKLKDEEMKARGLDRAGDDEEVLFDYDPESDGADENPVTDYDENEDLDDPDSVVTREGYLDRLHLDLYTSHQRVLSSDHKPLNAVFTLDYDAVVPELKSFIHHEVARELDRAENEGRPVITVVVDQPHDTKTSHSNQNSVDEYEGVYFGAVRYLRRQSQGLTIANTGQVAATFSFVGRPSDPGKPDLIAPEWLSINFGTDASDTLEPEGEVTLEPGDVVNATLEVYVKDIAQVRALNEGTLVLDDVLVLRVQDGKDHFVPIRGHWMQSCFGRSIAELIRVPEGGVRAMVPPRGAMESAPVVNRGQEVRWSAPRELFKLTEAVELLTERAVADRGMTGGDKAPLPEGWPFDSASSENDRVDHEAQRNSLLEALDTDRNLAESFSPDATAADRVEIIAEVLLDFLSSLSDGIITTELWEKLEHDMMARKKQPNAEEERAWVLDVLSNAPNHNISFVFLTSMLSKIATELTPIPHSESMASRIAMVNSLDFRRSISITGRGIPVQVDPERTKRQAIDRRYAEVFAAAVIRSSSTGRERDRRASDERKKEIIQVFLRSDAQGRR